MQQLRLSSELTRSQGLIWQGIEEKLSHSDYYQLERLFAYKMDVQSDGDTLVEVFN